MEYIVIDGRLPGSFKWGGEWKRGIKAHIGERIANTKGH